MTDTIGIEYTTVHDYKPTHRFAPDYVIAAREQYEQAWADHATLVDRKMDGENAFTWAEIEDAAEVAADLENKYYEIYQKWQNELGALMSGMDERHEAAHVMTEEGLP